MFQLDNAVVRIDRDHCPACCAAYDARALGLRMMGLAQLANRCGHVALVAAGFLAVGVILWSRPIAAVALMAQAFAVGAHFGLRGVVTRMTKRLSVLMRQALPEVAPAHRERAQA